MIRGARQLLTLRGPAGTHRGSQLNQLSIITDGSLLVRDGILQEVGPTRRIENLAAARQATEVGAAGRVVIPGFVDSHTHLLFPPPGVSRSTPEAGIRALHAMTASRLKGQAQSYLRQMARHGTTTAEVKTGCAPDESAEMKILRVAAELRQEPLHLLATVLVEARESSADPDTLDPGWKWICERFLPGVHRRRLAWFADLGSSGDLCRLEGPTHYLETARQLGFALKIHADQESPAAAIALGVTYGAVSVDHLEHARPEDAVRLARSGAVATVLPGASFYSGAPFAPARAFIDAGGAVALASNFNAIHTPTLSMQTVMAIACRYLGMTAEEAISAATINGAHALGLGGRIGSLEPGKVADVVILDTSDYRDLAHSLGCNLVRMCMKSGVIVYEEGGVVPRPADHLRPR